jgi:hypothetical protein
MAGKSTNSYGKTYNQYGISGWWFGTWLLFFHILGIIIIPTDELHHFSEG